FLLDAEYGVMEIEFEVILQIGAALRLVGTSAAAAHAAAEEVFKDVAEITERVHIEPGIEATAALHTFGAVTVVQAALLLIRDYLVGSHQLFELVFISGVGVVRVKLGSLLFKGFLYL